MNKDKLNTGFRALRKNNLLAKQAFSCCNSCACCELDELLEESDRDGAVYYHKQEAACMKKNGGVWLGYVAKDPSDIALTAIGNRVCSVLRQAGLTVEWEGTCNKKIWVQF